MASEDNISAFFRGSASRPGWPPALWLGPPQRRAGLDKTMESVEFESMSLFRIHPNKWQSFINCSPRPRGQGGRHGLEWAPVTPARNTRAGPQCNGGQLMHSIGYMPMSFDCRLARVDVDEDGSPLSSGVPRVGLLASRAVVGGALNAGLAWLKRLKMLI